MAKDSREKIPLILLKAETNCKIQVLSELYR